MRTENDPSSEDGVIEGNSQLAAAGAHSRRAFFGNAAVLGLGLAAGATTASAEPSKDGVVEAKIRRALLADPADLTKNATVVDRDAAGNMTVLRPGTNKWICMPVTRTRSAIRPCALTLSRCSGSPTPKQERRSLPTQFLVWPICFAERHSGVIPTRLTPQAPPSPSVRTG